MLDHVQVPMIAKTIEGMFHPRSLKMRHEIFKSRGTGVSGGGGGGGVAGVAVGAAGTAAGTAAAAGVGGGGAVGTGEGGSPQQPQAMGATMTTLHGKSRDDIQRIFVDVLREVGVIVCGEW